MKRRTPHAVATRPQDSGDSVQEPGRLGRLPVGLSRPRDLGPGQYLTENFAVQKGQRLTRLGLQFHSIAALGQLAEKPFDLLRDPWSRGGAYCGRE
jgi:hypothetical protein